MRGWLALLMMPVALAGCSFAKGEAFNAAAMPPLATGNARIIVFRQDGALGGPQTIPVTLDGEPFTKLQQNGYFWRDVPAGRHELEASFPLYLGTAKLGGPLQPGRIVYVEATLQEQRRPSLFFGPAAVFATSDTEQRGPYRLTETPATAALPALAKSHMQTPAPPPSLPGGDAPRL